MSIQIRATSPTAIIEITEGLISLKEVEGLKTALEEVLREGPQNIIVRFDPKVDLMNLKVWAILVKTAHDLRPQGKDIKLVSLNPLLEKDFKILKLPSVLETYPTEEAAIDSLGDNVSKVERNILWKLRT